jgi:hypothetical protein
MHHPSPSEEPTMSDATTNSTEDDAVFTDPDIANQIVTNDAVSGETVIDNGHYAGPEGSEPLEGSPEYAPNDLEGEPIDLDDKE